MARPPNKTADTGADEEARLKALALDIRERELALRERELDLKSRNQTWVAWTSPTFVGIFVAAIGLTGNAVVARINGHMTHELEQQRGEYARVLEMIKVGTPDQAAENLRMLLDSGLYTDKSGKLDGYLRSRKKGEGAFLPTTNASAVPAEPTPIKVLEKASQTDAPWLEIALKERGQKEISGPEDNPRILSYLRSTNWKGPIKEDIDWSSAFVNWVFEQSGREGTKSNSNASWEKWGVALSTPRPGALVIIRRGNEVRHVGFYAGPAASPNLIAVLGGNSQDAVALALIDKGRISSYRWPSEPASGR